MILMRKKIDNVAIKIENLDKNLKNLNIKLNYFSKNFVAVSNKNKKKNMKNYLI